MKRLTEGDTVVLPLKKRTSSLFSIKTIYESENDKSSSNCNSASSSTVGLDLMAKVESQYTSTTVPENSLGKGTCSQNPKAVSAPPLSSTEDSSCTEDEQEDMMSLTNGCLFKPSLRALKCQRNSASEKETDSDVVKEVICEPKEEHQNGKYNHSNDLRSGIVFEAGFNHYDRHNRLHKERPIRITSIMDHLKKEGNDIYSRCCVLGKEEDDSRMSPTQSAVDFLEDEDYLRVHLPGYMKRLEKLFDCNCCNEERLDQEAEQYKSIFFTKESFKEAKRAAASLCSLLENVVQGDLDNGFAVIRPPGHHAEPGLAGGYCIINNVAVAASYAKEKLGVKKILIVDWDVHLGNGTQSIFSKDPNIMYFSVHRWNGGNFFPFLANGGPTNVGVGEGTGYNMNVGWSRKGMGDDEYLAVWEKLLMPVAKEFQPELILVSAGFDAAQNDLGECEVTPECFGRLTRQLMTLNIPIVCSLEGGYVRSILGKCVHHVMASLLNPNSVEESKQEDDEDRRERGELDVLDTIDPTAAKDIRATIAAHRAYWNCLRSL